MDKHRLCPMRGAKAQVAIYAIDGEDIFECPVGLVDQDLSEEAFGLFNHYEQGYLPFGGGIYDQPERTLQMIEVVKAVRAEKNKDGK